MRGHSDAQKGNGVTSNDLIGRWQERDDGEMEKVWRRWQKSGCGLHFPGGDTSAQARDCRGRLCGCAWEHLLETLNFMSEHWLLSLSLWEPFLS